MTAEEQKAVEVILDYMRQGWILVALPKEIAATIVGEQASQQTALEFSSRIKELYIRLEAYGG